MAFTRLPNRRGGLRGRSGFAVGFDFDSGVVIANLARMAKNAPENLKAAKQEVDEEILEAAKARTPVDTTALRESGRVIETPRAGNFIGSSITFGGATPISGKNSPNGTVNYAVAVHEGTEVFHKNGQAKFLESAVNEAAPNYSARIVAKAGRNGEIFE